MTRYFRNKEEYFRFINKYRDRIDIDIVKILKTKVKVVYNITK